MPRLRYTYRQAYRDAWDVNEALGAALRTLNEDKAQLVKRVDELERHMDLLRRKGNAADVLVDYGRKNNA